MRTSGGESKGVIDRQPLKRGSSDGFTLGLLAMCLLFCKPFLGGEQKHLDRLDVQYYAQHAYRYACCIRKTERKEKCTWLGLITGASVPRSSPRSCCISLVACQKHVQLFIRFVDASGHACLQDVAPVQPLPKKARMVCMLMTSPKY